MEDYSPPEPSAWHRLPIGRRLSTIHGEAVIMTVIVAAVIAMATVDDYRRVYGVQERGVVATATIVAVESRRQNTDELVVRFTTREGVEVQARVGPQRWDGSPTIGDSQEVLYDPADPANEVLSRGARFAHYTHFLGAGVMILLLLLAVAMWRHGPFILGGPTRNRRPSGESG
ncbi:DUF3592 domain-containing protein [Streptosporangium lutulentum]